MATIEYEINGAGLNSLDPITGTANPRDFYDFVDLGGDPPYGYGGHGYGEQHVITMFVYHNTVDDQYAVILNCGYELEEYDGGWGAELHFTENVDTAADYVVKDDPGRDDFANTFESDYSRHGWGSDDSSSTDTSEADGWALKANAFQDVTFTVEENTEAPDRVNNRMPHDFRLITADGKPPDGGAVSYAGTDGSIRLTFTNLPPYETVVGTGDQVILLTENLAVHGAN